MICTENTVAEKENTGFAPVKPTAGVFVSQGAIGRLCDITFEDVTRIGVFKSVRLDAVDDTWVAATELGANETYFIPIARVRLIKLSR